VVRLELRQVFTYTTFGYGYIVANTRGINMSGTSEFTLSTLFNLISFIGIVLLLTGVNPIVGGSLVAIGLVAFSLLIVFHKV
jgi:hypothetical protein